MKKFLAVLMSIVVVITCSVSVFAVENAPVESSVARYRVAEFTELRESNSNTYLLSDGTRECVVYAEDKYYREDSGEYVEINNAIVPTEYKGKGASYGYMNAANSTKVYFSEDAPSVLIESGNGKLAFSFVGSGAVNARTGVKGSKYKFSGYELQADNCIAYTGVCKSTDLIYSVNAGYVKEYLVLSDADAPTQFLFAFNTTECSIKANENGSLDVYDLSGKLTFQLGSLFAVDSAGNYTDSLRYEIEEVTEDTTTVRVSIDSDYLNDPDRVFPVLIDPSVMVTGDLSTYDACVCSKFPTTNYYVNDYLRSGQDDEYGVRRTYIKFDLPSQVTSSNLTSAFIDLKYCGGVAPTTKAYRVTGNWSSSTITWINKPTYTSAGASATATLYGNNWYRMYVTDIVRGWYAGSYSNYGFVVRDVTESDISHWTTFYSSDAPSPNKPELHLYYVYNGTRPYQATSRTDVNCMGYALEYASYISGDSLNLSLDEMSGKTTAQLQTYIAGKAEAWMNSHLGTSNYGVISAYDSDINTGWYRVILRVGFIDKDGDGVFDKNETYDYHWWYQTSTGNWADKLGQLSSTYRSNTYNVNPASLTWKNGSLYYNSSGKFYQIKDIRTISW